MDGRVVALGGADVVATPERVTAQYGYPNLDPTHDISTLIIRPAQDLAAINGGNEKRRRLPKSQSFPDSSADISFRGSPTTSHAAKPSRTSSRVNFSVAATISPVCASSIHIDHSLP